MADVVIQGHDRIIFPAGSDRRFIFQVLQLPDLHGLQEAVWLLIPGYVDLKGRTLDLGDAAVITKALDNGIEVLSSEDEVIAVTVDATDTDPGAGQDQITGDFYDLFKLKLASGKQDEVVRGNYKILPTHHTVL